MIGGVLAGFANYLGTDPTLVRILYVVFGVLTGVWLAILVYVVAMIVIPEEPAGGTHVEPTSWPQTGAPRVEPSSRPSSGWPHTGTESVQEPPPPPAAPGEEPPPAAKGPAQS
jgi:phage shock protein PspC (stress-responsive transcriptional regulator)